MSFTVDDGASASPPADFTPREHLSAAMSAWEQNTGLTLQSGGGSAADIRIVWVASQSHVPAGGWEVANALGQAERFLRSDGSIDYAVVWVNLLDYSDITWNDESLNCPNNEYDLTGLLVHELGHCLGMDDVEQGIQCSVMDSRIPLNACDRRTIRTYDVMAIKCIYEDMRTTWGKIKALYEQYRQSSDALSLSGISNTLVWNHLPNAAERKYFVYRSKDDSDEVKLMGTTLGDSVFVDTQTVFGERYRYHIACAEDSILLEVGTPVAGLKLVRDHVLEDPHNQGTVDLAVRGSVVYVALDHEIRRYDFTDPESPVETARRELPGMLVKNILLDEGGTTLIVVGSTNLMTLGANQAGLPVLDEISGIATGSGASGDAILDVTVDRGVVYLACGIRGLKAYDFTVPDNLRVAGNYDPDGLAAERVVYSVAVAGDYAYVSTDELSSNADKFERLRVIRSGGPPLLQWWVSFEVECTSDDAGCWDAGLVGAEMATHTNRGPYQLAYDLKGERYLLLNSAIPAAPEAMRMVDAPAVGPAWVVADSTGVVDTLTFFSTFESVDFDGRFMYATTPMWADPYDRSLVAFKIWDTGPDLMFAAGDTLGDNIGATVRSHGRYLYLFDSFLPRNSSPEAQREPRIRVYRKATGCEPDSEDPVRVFPTSEAHKIGEEIAVVWSVGCPTESVVELLQDGVVVEPIVSKSSPLEDDIAHHSNWIVSLSGSGLEDHTYQVRVNAAYSDRPDAAYVSAPFRLEVGAVHEVAIGGGKPFVSIQSAINASASGDTVLVHAGIYAEPLTLKSNVRVVGRPGAVIEPPAAGPAMMAANLVHPPTLDGLTFSAAPGATMGAIVVNGCGITVRNCAFSSLTRAVEITDGYGQFTSCDFTNNTDAAAGGAVWINAASSGPATTFTGCRFAGNSAGTRGGAVYIASEAAYSTTSPQVSFLRCTFAENEAPEAAVVRVGNFTRPVFEACVFHENQALAASGGSLLGGIGNARLTNCTFADNASTQAFDLIRLEPAVGVPATMVQSSLFAGNVNANALGAFGSTYAVTGSNFHGNGAEDASCVASGSLNFSANPAFCPSGDYSIQAFSPCAAGVTGFGLVGAKDIGCAPDVVVTVLPGGSNPPDSLLFACPGGDGDTLSIVVDLDEAVMTRTVQASELSIEPPYGPVGIFSDVTVRAEAPGAAPNYVMTIGHRYLSGRGRDSLTVYLNGYPLAQKALVRRRGPDLTGPGGVPDGRMTLSDFGQFSLYFATAGNPNAPYEPYCDFDASGPPISFADFNRFAYHYSPVHDQPFMQPLGFTIERPLAAVESPAQVSLEFTEEYVTALSRRLLVDVTLKDFAGVSLCLFALRRNREDIQLVEWQPTEWGARNAMFTEVDRGATREYYFGLMMHDAVDGVSEPVGRLVFALNSTAPVEVSPEQFALVVGDLMVGHGVTGYAAEMSGVLGRMLNQKVNRVYHNRLEQNYPNPFNPTTTIAFSLREQGDVRLTIYDVAGRRVRDLLQGRRDRGIHKVVWDGRNSQGSTVASGVYFYKLTAGSFIDTKKMTILK